MLLRNLQQQLKYSQTLYRQHCFQKRQYAKLLQVMREKSIRTFFQPIVSVGNGAILGYEALNRPNACNVFSSTEEFYKFLGETDQIFHFEKLVRQQSLERYVALKASDRPEGEEGLVFLNVHPLVLSDTNYRSGKTLRFIENFQLAPRQIVFEITEKQAVRDYIQFERVLTNYRSQGFKIAIDDVGAGYNSLKTLMLVQPDYIKLDRSFIQNIDQAPMQQNLVRLFVEYAVQANSQVIAEGVERSEELSVLKEMGVNFAQGYFLGKPSQVLSPVVKKE